MTDLGKKILSGALVCLMMGALVVYGYRNKELFAGLLEVQAGFILVLAGMWVALLRLAGERTQLFVGLFDVDLPAREALRLEIATSMSGYLIPFKGSQVTKAVYLKKRHGFPYAGFVTVLLASYPLKFLAVAVTGVALSLLLYFERGMLELRVLGFFLILMAFTGVVLKVPISIPATQNKLLEGLRSALEGWQLLREDPSLILRIMLLFAASCVVVGGQLFVAYNALSIGAELLPALLIGTLYTFTFFTSATPGSSGFAEAVAGAASHLLQIGFAEGVVTAVLVRGVNTGMALLIGPIIGYLMTRRHGEPVPEVGS